MAPTMKAVHFSASYPTLTRIVDLPIPVPAEGEVLIRNVAVASNPKDWKCPEVDPTAVRVEGNDVAGVVESVGEGVGEFEKGDRVAAFTKMMDADNYGAYAEYTIAPSHLVWPLASTTSFEEAVTLPLAMMTAALALFVTLPLTPPPVSGGRPPRPDEVVLINGGASSVGAFAVQLAKRAGYSVVATAGQSAEIPLSLGADQVVDYRGKGEEELAREVRDAVARCGVRARVVGAFDTVSKEGTVKMLGRAMQPEGGKVTVILFDLEGKGYTPENVSIEATNVASAYGKDTEFARTYYRAVGHWLDDGSFKANQVKLLPHGLDSVAEGVQLLKEGKVNGEKLVYRIEDSKCLKQ